MKYCNSSWRFWKNGQTMLNFKKELEKYCRYYEFILLGRFHLPLRIKSHETKPRARIAFTIVKVAASLCRMTPSHKLDSKSRRAQPMSCSAVQHFKALYSMWCSIRWSGVCSVSSKLRVAVTKYNFSIRFAISHVVFLQNASMRKNLGKHEIKGNKFIGHYKMRFQVVLNLQGSLYERTCSIFQNLSLVLMYYINIFNVFIFIFLYLHIYILYFYIYGIIHSLITICG